MNRRGFLGFLGAAIAGATLDKDRLLWEPGKKFISIPAPKVVARGTAGQIINDAYRRLGLIDGGMTLSAADIEFAYASVNKMLDSWGRMPNGMELANKIAPSYGIRERYLL